MELLKEFIEVFYSFRFLYSYSLHNYLSGYDCSTASYSGRHLYSLFFGATLIITLIILFIYYYFIDPVNDKGKKWLIAAGIAAAISGLVATFWILSDAESFLIGDCLLRDDSGNTLIAFVDYVGLGINNAIVSLVKKTGIGVIS